MAGFDKTKILNKEENITNERTSTFVAENIRSSVSDEDTTAIEDMKLINKFSVAELQKKDVHIRSMYLCNNMVDSYYSRFTEQALSEIAEKVVGQSVISGHNTSTLPMARFFKARVEEKDGALWVRAWFYWAADTEGSDTLKKNIDAGVYREVSISFSCKDATCNICKKDIRECEHIPGRGYDGITCYYDMSNMEQVYEGSLVYKGAQTNTTLAGERKEDSDTIEAEKAQWTAKYINNLPDASFAVISEGGEKDDEGKTTPRSLRHLPHHSSSVTSGSDNDTVDKPHLRNALARLEQTNISSALKTKARNHLVKHAKALGIGEYLEEINEEETLMGKENAVETVKTVSVDVDPKVFEQRLVELASDLEKAKSALSEKEISLEKAVEETAQLRLDIIAKDSKIAEQELRLAEVAKERKAERTNTYVEGLKKQGKVTPAMEENVRKVLLDATEDSEKQLKSIFDNMPKVVEFTELGETTDTREHAIETLTDEVPASESVDNLTSAWMKKNNSTDYEAAFKFVEETYPEIVSKYLNQE